MGTVVVAAGLVVSRLFFFCCCLLQVLRFVLREEIFSLYNLKSMPASCLRVYSTYGSLIGVEYLSVLNSENEMLYPWLYDQMPDICASSKRLQ
jgi:hypothetical protein